MLLQLLFSVAVFDEFMVKATRLEEVFKGLGVVCLCFVYVWMACSRESRSFDNNSAEVEV
jgi:hypothetical protein